jgi:hypothetical protein
MKTFYKILEKEISTKNGQKLNDLEKDALAEFLVYLST